MKIEFKNRSNVVKFGDLKVGAEFSLLDIGNAVCIKIENPYISGSKMPLNVVQFTAHNGEFRTETRFFNLPDEELVEERKIKIVVEE